MPSILDRMRSNISKSFGVLQTAESVEDIEKRFDVMFKEALDNMPDIEPPDWKVAQRAEELIDKEFQTPKSKLKVFSQNSSMMAGYYSTILGRVVKIAENELEDLPTNDPYVDHILAEFWKHEPILAGAVYTMASKMSTLSWTLVGKKGVVTEFADVLDNSISLGGRGWGKFIAATTQDYITTNRGSFWQIVRNGNHLYGKLSELAVLDSLCCALTGNPRQPVFYSSAVLGDDMWFRQGEVNHFTSLTSPREQNLGSGLCAVFRAYKSARILLGLSRYDWEKLNNLPPEGVAAVSGMSQDEFQDALSLWRAAREVNKNLTFPQVLWLLGSNPGAQVNVDFVGFSQIPESFTRKDVIEQYVNTLALDFGVDAREFWPISSGTLGTASETEVQHMKAKGKGPGEFITSIERYLNGEMPEGEGEFAFDTQDVGEDQIAAAIAKGWVDAFMPLYAPGKGTSQTKEPMAPTVTSPEGAASQQNTKQGTGEGAEPLITKEQFLRLLVDRRVLPNWIVQDDKVAMTDVGITVKELWDVDPDDTISITYKHGTLSYARPVYHLNSGQEQRNQGNGTNTHDSGQNGSSDGFGVPDALEKELAKPNIKGRPISDKESLRGPKITGNTVKSELDLWLKTPELLAYVPTPDEHEYTQVLNSTIGG